MYHDCNISEPSLVIADDMLYGAAAIADFLGIPRRKVFYLLERRRIPAGKLGREHVASRSALREHFTRLAHGEGRPWRTA